MENEKKKWYNRWWAIGLFYIFIGLIVLEIFTPEETSKQNVIGKQPQEVLEMTTQQIFKDFSELSDLQVEEKIKKLKGKRIKTSLYVDKIDKASLSSQYVAMEMYEYPYNLLPAVKAFFPAEEKYKLLKANIGDTIIFSGQFVTYHRGGLTSYIEFTNSKLIEVKEKEEK